MVDHVAGVAVCGEQSAGEHRILELETHEVETGHGLDDAPVVIHVTVTVEDRQVDPGESRLEPGAPDDVGRVENGGLA